MENPENLGASANTQEIVVDAENLFGKVQDLSEEQIKSAILKVRTNIKDSAFVKHLVGRHRPVKYDVNVPDISNTEKSIIDTIFTLQRSELMEEIRTFKVNLLHSCCAETLKLLSIDFREACRLTKINYSEWHKERRFRVTGSVCYNLYTYTFNKEPDWKKKCEDYFSPKHFRNEYTEYGKKTESEAREAFKQATNKIVVETGLVISQQNPWLAYSPDGVIVKDGVIVELLEIKCPFRGKNQDIMATVSSEIGKSLVMKGENILLKKKHKYYGQIQLGMAVLNVRKTSFVFYSSFDKTSFILSIDFDEDFVKAMLISLKIAYFQNMIHFTCKMRMKVIASH